MKSMRIHNLFTFLFKKGKTSGPGKSPALFFGAFMQKIGLKSRSGFENTKLSPMIPEQDRIHSGYPNISTDLTTPAKKEPVHHQTFFGAKQTFKQDLAGPDKNQIKTSEEIVFLKEVLISEPIPSGKENHPTDLKGEAQTVISTAMNTRKMGVEGANQSKQITDLNADDPKSKVLYPTFPLKRKNSGKKAIPFPVKTDKQPDVKVVEKNITGPKELQGQNPHMDPIKGQKMQQSSQPAIPIKASNNKANPAILFGHGKVNQQSPEPNPAGVADQLGAFSIKKVIPNIFSKLFNSKNKINSEVKGGKSSSELVINDKTSKPKSSRALNVKTGWSEEIKRPDVFRTGQNKLMAEPAVRDESRASKITPTIAKAGDWPIQTMDQTSAPKESILLKLFHKLFSREAPLEPTHQAAVKKSNSRGEILRIEPNSMSKSEGNTKPLNVAVPNDQNSQANLANPESGDKRSKGFAAEQLRSEGRAMPTAFTQFTSLPVETPKPASHPPLVDRILQFIVTNHNGKINQAVLKINSAVLGKMEIHFKEVAKNKEVTLLVENETAKSEIERLLPRINEALQQRGIDLNSLKVDLYNYSQKKEQEHHKADKPLNTLHTNQEEVPDEPKKSTVKVRHYGYNTIEVIA